MIKKEQIQQIYAIVIGVLVVAMGVAFICVAADIYYSNRDTGVAFPQETVVQRLRILAIPLGILIAAIAAGVIFPLYEIRAKFTSEHTARLLSIKLPSGGEGDEYEEAKARYNKLNKLRLILWLVVGAILLACVIATLCYMLNAANFLSDSITDDMLAMVKNVLPWIIVSFATLIVATILSGINAQKRVEAIKNLIKHGNGVAATPSELKFIATARKLINNNITLWVVRGIVFVISVTFIVLGIVNGGARDVLIKAINICTECIGLG